MKSLTAFLTEYYWLSAIAAAVFFLLTVIFAACVGVLYKREKQTRTESERVKDKAEQLSLQIETLRAEIEAVRAIRDASFAPPVITVQAAEYPDGEPDDAPLLLDEILDPRIFETTVDRNLRALRSAKTENASYTVVYDDAKKDWAVRKYGTLRAIRRFRQKEDALRAAQELTRKQTVKKSR